MSDSIRNFIPRIRNGFARESRPEKPLSRDVAIGTPPAPRSKFKLPGWRWLTKKFGGRDAKADSRAESLSNLAKLRRRFQDKNFSKVLEHHLVLEAAEKTFDMDNINFYKAAMGINVNGSEASVRAADSLRDMYIDVSSKQSINISDPLRAALIDSLNKYVKSPDDKRAQHDLGADLSKTQKEVELLLKQGLLRSLETSLGIGDIQRVFQDRYMPSEQRRRLDRKSEGEEEGNPSQENSLVSDSSRSSVSFVERDDQKCDTFTEVSCTTYAVPKSSSPDPEPATPVATVALDDKMNRSRSRSASLSELEMHTVY
jgi:ribosome-associated translation inhibitor RaiA